MSKPAITIITYPDLNAASGASQLLYRSSEAQLKITSAYMIARSLEYVSILNPKQIHICAVGIHCPVNDLLNVLNKLSRNNRKIYWYCGYDYLDEHRPALEPYCECVFTGRDENIAETLYHHLNPKGTDDDRANLIRYVGTEFDEEKKLPARWRGRWEEISRLRHLIEAAIWRYFNFRDYEAYPHAIRVLAGLEPMTELDRKFIDSWKREGRHILLGKSPAITQVKLMIPKLAESDAAVLITGETGTGKEVVARLIHESSARRGQPIVAMNCATLTGDLQQDALFGHVRGAFTGATKDAAGVFETANGGTVFLDEVGELQADTQAKLLRVLQTGIIQRVGEIRDRQTDVRIIAATNRDLLAEVRQGRFREDLYYRLAVLRVHLPPLRERPDDIPIIARDLLYRHGHDSPRLSSRQVEALKRYPWPGNVRELQNVIERHVTLGEPDMSKLFDQDPTGHISMKPDSFEALEDYEAAYIRHVYESLDRNKSKTCDVLKVTRNTLKAKLKKYGIEK